MIAPEDEAGVMEAVARASAAGRKLRIAGGGTQTGLAADDDTLCLAAHRGIVFYAPEELVIRARAGTPIAEIEAALAGAGQHLIAEPPDLRGLLGTTGVPTLGGAVAANLAGPRRVHAGAMRDHVLGMRFVTGDGRLFRAGGRVLKNVTGLDVGKLVAGSHGRLGAITEVTLKVFPNTERVGSVAITGLDPQAAVAAMAAALRSPFGVSAAAHIPPCVRHPQGLTAVRIEDFAASTAYRCDRLCRLLAPFGAGELLDDAASRTLWREIRDVAPLAGAGPCVWRVTMRPSTSASAAARIGASGGRWMMDWGGAVLWVAGEANLAASRAEGETWAAFRGEPVAAEERAEMMRVRKVLDPSGVFAGA